MKIYYQNEVLHVEVNKILEEQDYKGFKKRFFKIVKDYEIDHIVLHSSFSSINVQKQLQQIQLEYYQNFDGLCFIK